MATVSYSREHNTFMSILRPLLSKSISNNNHYAPLVPYPSSSSSSSSFSFSSIPITNKKKQVSLLCTYNFHPLIQNEFISSIQMDILCTIISHIGPIGYSKPLYRAIEFFKFFGIHEYFIKWLHKLLDLYHYGGLSIEHIKNTLVTLQKFHPHVYD